MFLKDFTVLDLAYIDASRGLVGESYYVSVEITGSLDHQGFVLDFGVAKKILKAHIDSFYDHRCLVPGRSKNIQMAKHPSNEVELVANTNRYLQYRAPSEAIAMIDDENISPKSLEIELSKTLLGILPKSISEIKIELSSSLGQAAQYSYTHGLRYHDGNCQRLFHGHRNPVEVLVEGRRQPEYEKYLAQYCEDAHFVAAENLTNRYLLDLPLETRRRDHSLMGEIRYRSTQGQFFGLVPANQLIVLADEPSVENIAAFLLRAIKREYSLGSAAVEVRAYEGLNKGAVAV